MKKYLSILLLLFMLFFSACILDNTQEENDNSINELKPSRDFKFNTNMIVSISLTSYDVQGNMIPNAQFQLYKKNPLEENSCKLLTSSTNDGGIFESTIVLPTYMTSIYLRSASGFVYELPVARLSNTEGAITNDFTYIKPVMESEDSKMSLDDFPYMTVWAVDEQPGKLYYFVLSNGTFSNLEGSLKGISGSIDVEDIAIDSTGVIYIMNNFKTSKLYKILPSEIDRDPKTPVNVTYIGDTGLPAGSTKEEICALQFFNGDLFGIGKQSKKVYEIDINDGSIEHFGNIVIPSGDFKIDAFSAGSDGNVYLIKTMDSNSELWRVVMSKQKAEDIELEYVLTIQGSGKVEALTAHPNGYLYAADNQYWYVLDPQNGASKKLFSYSSDIEGMDFYYYGECSYDSDNDGVPDGQDDYPNDPDKAFNDWFPSEDEFSTLMYEDLWPNKGDYDMNDLVIDYQMVGVTNAKREMVSGFTNFTLRAAGAGYNIGFAIQFSEYNTFSNLNDELGLAYLEEDQRTICFFTNHRLAELFGAPGGDWINTNPNDPTYYTPISWTVNIDVQDSSPKDIKDDYKPWYSPPFNPFIFVNGNRGHEIHLPDYPYTSKMDTDLFNTGDDATDPNEGLYFRTADYLPWVINIAESMDYCEEGVQITQAFNHFVEWVNSDGNHYADWYKDYPGYRNNDLIYSVPGKWYK